MRITSLIFMLFIVGACFAGNFDNPYMGYYITSAQLSDDFDVVYMKYYNAMSKLELNRANARACEQSTANKLFGAAAIGATGIGAMNLLSGLAEQSADAAAEKDMKAYLATFVCDYGAGRNVRGGETSVELPGGNNLIALRQEYRALAVDLKAWKEALDMLPGLESMVVFDATETGLYDNAAVGRQGGAYMSLSRALTDGTSSDAAALAEQKSDTKSKIQKWAIVGGAGAVDGAIGNAFINSSLKETDSQPETESVK